ISNAVKEIEMYTHILAPTDGSEFAKRGVGHALALAMALDCKVTIMTVTDLSALMYEGWVPDSGGSGRFVEENQAAATRFLATLKSRAEERGVAANTEHVVSVSAAEAILEASQRLGCDLIVMSSHGR